MKGRRGARPRSGHGRGAARLPDKPSIAVLPFQNMSGDPEQEYFADGIVEDIITALSRFKLAVRHRAQFELRLQGPGGRREAGRARARRALRARRQRAQGRRPRAHHRPADRCRDRQPSLGRALRPALDDIFDAAGRDRHERRRRHRAEAAQGGDRARSASRRRASTPTTSCCGAAVRLQAYRAGSRDAIPLLYKALSARTGPMRRACALACATIQFSRAGLPRRIARRRFPMPARRLRPERRSDSARMAGFVVSLDAHDYETALGLFDRAIALSNSVALRCVRVH